jgi:hypothetical protein
LRAKRKNFLKVNPGLVRRHRFAKAYSIVFTFNFWVIILVTNYKQIVIIILKLFLWENWLPNNNWSKS